MKNSLASNCLLLGIALVILGLSLSCGNGGGNGAAMAQSMCAGGILHYSTMTTSAITIPASNITIARSVTFIPDVDEVILSITCEGTYTNFSSKPDDSYLCISVRPQGDFWQDSLHSLIGYSGTDKAFQVEVSNMMWRSAASYTIQLIFNTKENWVGSVNSIQFKILTLKVSKINPSPNISD